MSSEQKKQPNILFVMADQMTPFMLDVCAGVGARMSNLRALAERGVQFTNALMSIFKGPWHVWPFARPPDAGAKFRPLHDGRRKGSTTVDHALMRGLVTA